MGRRQPVRGPGSLLQDPAVNQVSADCPHVAHLWPLFLLNRREFTLSRQGRREARLRKFGQDGLDAGGLQPSEAFVLAPLCTYHGL